MKVLQLIDSLEPGGAEKLAVTLANYLAQDVDASYLCTTRREGLLKEMLDASVKYIFLNKSGTLDIRAFSGLLKCVRKEGIDVIHAHSSSFFWATMVKILIPRVRLVWHDHFGDSEHLENRRYRTLRFCSRYFNSIISVNNILRDWARQNLRCKNVVFLNNFVVPDTLVPGIELNGDPDLRIVCLANLRPQKDHVNLLKAFRIILNSFPEATLHCLGKISDDTYYANLQTFIIENKLSGVYLHGAQKGIHHLLEQAAIGVLSSESEGLPLALLEYGLAGLPVVCTDVGQCKEVVGNSGIVVPAGSPEELAFAIITYLSEREKAKNDSFQFSHRVSQSYSFKAILPQLMNIYTG